MNDARDLVAQVFARSYRAAGGTGDPADAVRVARMRFPETRARPTGASYGPPTFRRLHPDEGRGQYELSFNQTTRGPGRLPTSELRAIATSGASLARAERRRAAIDAFGDGRDPSWSMTAHPLVAAFVRLHGIPVEPAHVADEPFPAGEEDDLADMDSVRAYEFGDACANLRTAAGHLWAASLSERRTGLSITQRYGRAEARLSVAGMELPETALAMLSGRPLADLLDHPLVDMVPHLRIRRIDNRRAQSPKATPRVDAVLAAPAIALAEAPSGADADWRRLPVVHYGETE